MIKIQVAGAGAGKTFGLAQKIAESIEIDNSVKAVYAITYTNSARSKIERQLNDILGYIPKRVRVETVHSFLLNRIIFPYSPFVTGTVYTNATTASLSSDVRYRNRQKGRLKEKKILHVDDVYIAARRILDKRHSTHNTKRKKAKVDRVLEILSCSIDRIFIDEVQDLDATALSVFEILGKSAAEVYMVGDPKQAIKYAGKFIELVNKYEDGHDSAVEVLPHENVTRRVPKGILVLSNKFCFEGQEQTSISEEQGSLSYIESTCQAYQAFLNASVANGSIVCIDRKCSGYLTHGIAHELPEDICDLVRDACGYYDPQLYLKAAGLRFFRHVASLGRKKAVGKFLKEYEIEYEPKRYAILINAAENREAKDGILIRSIDSVKGLEADDCVLVLTPNMFNYLTKNSLTPANHHNIEWNRLYVAITRAKKRFIVAVDHDLFKSSKYAVDDVRAKLEEYGFGTIAVEE